jgi:hypothetical protein
LRAPPAGRLQAGGRCHAGQQRAEQGDVQVVLAPERRLALIDWAARRKAVIIEDDYDAEFRYNRESVSALQGLAPSQVIALGTVSKSLAPALRLGWIASPSTLAEPVARAKSSATTDHRDWISSHWPCSSRLADTTGTCGECAPNTPPAARYSSRRSPRRAGRSPAAQRRHQGVLNTAAREPIMPAGGKGRTLRAKRLVAEPRRHPLTLKQRGVRSGRRDKPCLTVAAAPNGMI